MQNTDPLVADETFRVDWSPLFQFDIERLQLRNARTGRLCSLTRNEALMLEALVAGVCAKSDLMDEVWTRHGTIVTENSYYQLVSLLRKSFASIDLAGTVVTLPRKGLALTAEQAHALSAERTAGVEARPPQEPASGVANGELSGEAFTQHPQVVPGAAAKPDDIDIEIDASRNEPVSRPSLTPPGSREGVDDGAPAGEGTRSLRRSPGRQSTYASRRRSMIALAALGALIAGTAGLGFGAWLSGGRDTHMDAPIRSARYARVDAAKVVDIDLHYADMPEATALRIWRDVEARAGLPAEQRAQVFITEYRNRYAVLACSGQPDFPATQCFTVTESL